MWPFRKQDPRTRRYASTVHVVWSKQYDKEVTVEFTKEEIPGSSTAYKLMILVLLHRIPVRTIDARDIPELKYWWGNDRVAPFVHRRDVKVIKKLLKKILTLDELVWILDNQARRRDRDVV